jgi:hypothetical protein
MTSTALKDNTAPTAKICDAPAYQGRDVNLREGRIGTWRCAQHLWPTQNGCRATVQRGSPSEIQHPATKGDSRWLMNF